MRALFLDFDSTISTPTWQAEAGEWAVADKRELFASMPPRRQIENLGGEARVSALYALLHELSHAGVELFIVSIGYKAAFAPHLQTAGLLGFFPPAHVFGQDSPELRSVGFVKGALIQRIMASRGWAMEEVLFVDDSAGHIEEASRICRTLLVSAESKRTVGGMAQAELSAIREACLPTR